MISAWSDGHLSAAVLAPVSIRPDSLIAAAVKRSGIDADGRSPERVPTALMARHGKLEAGYNQTRFAVGRFAELDERGLIAWAHGLTLGVGILDAAWQTEEFTADERRSLSSMAALAEGERVDMDARNEVVQFIRARMTMRGGGGP